jgi:hypothetical protein
MYHSLVTNEEVARALGWKLESDVTQRGMDRLTPWWIPPYPENAGPTPLPAFVSDLDVITKEILSRGRPCYDFVLQYINPRCFHLREVWDPGILCGVLMVYLEKEKNSIANTFQRERPDVVTGTNC